MAYRLKTPEGKTLYALRKQRPERVFGIIKSVLGFRQFSLRGLQNVRGEWVHIFEELRGLGFMTAATVRCGGMLRAGRRIAAAPQPKHIFLSFAPSPTAGVIDSQSVKATQAETRGYDAGKKIVGSKRHIAVDTEGRLLMVNLTIADISDSAGAQAILDGIRKRWPWVKHLFADGAYDRLEQFWLTLELPDHWIVSAMTWVQPFWPEKLPR